MADGIRCLIERTGVRLRVLPPRRRRMAGFSVIEVVLALSILVLVASLAVLLLSRYQQRRRCAAFIADLHEISAVFQNSPPPASDVSVSAGSPALPVALTEALKGTRWFKVSPFGGNYGWVAPNAAGTSARNRNGAIVLTAFAPSFPLTLSTADLLHIDDSLDDGNLATGRFRTGFNGWPVYLVDDTR